MVAFKVSRVTDNSVVPPFNSNRSSLIADIGILVKFAPIPENPAPVEVINPDTTTLPETLIPLFTIDILSVPLVLKTILLVDDNVIELLESKSKSKLLL
jgi:hypothetical protein